jgi:DNA-binding MarR family transcriptional regulator
MPANDELLAAQAALEAKRRILGIPERGAPPPKPDAELPGNLSDEALRFLAELPADQRERAVNNLTKEPPPESATPVGSVAAKIVRQSSERARAHAAAREEHAAEPKPARGKGTPKRAPEDSTSWGKLRASLVAAPQFRTLGARDLHVLCALIAYRDNKTGESAPGREIIETLIGRKGRTVDRALRSLIDRGLIRQTRRACIGRNPSYRIAENGREIAANLNA